MTKTVDVRVKVPTALLQKAKPLLALNGLTPAKALKLFLTSVVYEGLPEWLTSHEANEAADQTTKVTVRQRPKT
jgi:antitoxin component of RelBE/YafQ-DinJ toxin-antitoxin module